MKQLTKFVLICITFVGFSLLTQAAVNLWTPKPKIISATIDDERNVELVVEVVNTEILDLYEYIIWYTL